MNEKEYMKLWGSHCVLLREYNEFGLHMLTLAAFNPGSPDPDYEQNNN